MWATDVDCTGMPDTYILSRRHHISSASVWESLCVHSTDVLWDCLDGLCLREKEHHPTLGKPEELLALMLKKR